MVVTAVGTAGRGGMLYSRATNTSTTPAVAAASTAGASASSATGRSEPTTATYYRGSCSPLLSGGCLASSPTSSSPSTTPRVSKWVWLSYLLYAAAMYFLATTYSPSSSDSSDAPPTTLNHTALVAMHRRLLSTFLFPIPTASSSPFFRVRATPLAFVPMEVFQLRLPSPLLLQFASFPGLYSNRTSDGEPGVAEPSEADLRWMSVADRARCIVAFLRPSIRDTHSGQSTGKWDSQDFPYLGQVLAHLFQTYSVDLTRVYLTTSDGAAVVSDLAVQFPSLFAAAHMRDGSLGTQVPNPHRARTFPSLPPLLLELSQAAPRRLRDQAVVAHLAFRRAGYTAAYQVVNQTAGEFALDDEVRVWQWLSQHRSGQQVEDAGWWRAHVAEVLQGKPGDESEALSGH